MIDGNNRYWWDQMIQQFNGYEHIAPNPVCTVGYKYDVGLADSIGWTKFAAGVDAADGVGYPPRPVLSLLAGTRELTPRY
jgi:hypothetical protein